MSAGDLIASGVTRLAPASGAVHDQGARPVCLPVAVSVAHQIARGAGHEPFAPDALWEAALYAGTATADGSSPDGIGTALSAEGQPMLKHWPFDATLIGPGASPRPASCPPPPWRRGHLNAFPMPATAARLVAAVTAGIPVVTLIDVTEAFTMVGADGLVADVSGAVSYGLHAVVAVGSGLPNGDEGVLIRNSWGADWGLEGHCYLSAAYVAEYVRSAWFVTPS